MAQVSVGLRLDEDLLARMDEARGDVPRARWVARALEAALVVEKSRRGAGAAARAIVAEPERYSRATVETAEQALSDAKEPFRSEQADPGSVSSSEGVRSAAPAEQLPSVDDLRAAAFVRENPPMSAEELRRFGARSSSFAKRDVRPVPKKGA